MTDPRKVLGFLDVTGNWNPSLLLVLGGAVILSAVAFLFIQRRGKPVFDTGFHLPPRPASTPGCWVARPCSAWAGV